MPESVRGVVSRAQDQPVELVDITVPDPGPRDVVVEVQACGVCHTDHNYVTGANGDDFPFLLGHEAAGVVSTVGAAVTHVAPGDFVILNWRAVCGDCRACRKGQPWYCFDTCNASRKMTLADGTELEPALGIGAFTEKTLVHELQCTPVDPKAAPEVAGLLGCGVMAGIGAALNTGAVQRGESVAVIGCGGVGDAAIVGSLLGGATTVIGLDRSDAKLTKAAELGATATVNTDGLSTEEIVEQVQALTGGFGPDLVIDAVGLPATYEQAFRMRDLAGRVVLVGVPDPSAEITLPMAEVFGRGGALKSSWYGDCLPERDFPYLIDLHLQDRLPLEEFVTETCELGDVEQAFAKMADGSVLRSVVVL